MKTARISIFALAMLALTAACHKTKHEAAPGGKPQIDVAEAVTDSVTLYKNYPGTIHAVDAVDIMCRVNGTLKTQNYVSGAQVSKGQVLFTIDDPTYHNNLAEAQAALARAQSDNQYAETHYTAVEAAYKRNASSQMELSQALSNRDASRAAVTDAQAALKQARDELDRCTIRAPFAGRVSAGEYSVGAYLAGAASPVKVASIYADNRVDAYFYIEDASFLRMFNNENNRSLINYDSIPISFTEKLPHTYSGELFYISPNVDPTTGALLLRCRIDNDYGELRSGMYASIDLPYKVEPKAVLVRTASIGTDQLGKYVYAVNDSGMVLYTPVVVGSQIDDTMSVITDGLRAGQRYVTQAMLKVRDSMEIAPRLVPTKR